MTDKGKLASARRIVSNLEKCLHVAQDEFPSQGHDDNEALISVLEKALQTARNVARNVGEKD